MLLLSGCGLESFIVLSTPVPDYTANTSDLFRFTKTVGNSEAEFQGFELYYKIYGLGEAPENTIGTFDQLVATPYFRRINNYPTDQSQSYVRPLIKISGANRAAEFKITIDFSVDLSNAGSVAYPKIYSDTSAPVPFEIDAIRRDVLYSFPRTTEFKKFSYDSDPIAKVFEQSDADLSPQAWQDISTSNQAQIALYVLSYGFDPVTSSVLYSLPVYLGSLDRVTFPPP